jgi:hypothetical protein
MRITIREAGSRRAVMDFNVIRDRRMHVIVVDQALETFAHLHPEQLDDGSWSVVHTLPRPGFYRAVVQFSPFSGLPQELARTFATAGYGGDLGASRRPPGTGSARSRMAGDTRVALVMDPDPARAGLTGKLRYDLTASGQPVTDLEPYDGGWGQAVVLGEDGLEFVRADAIEGVPADVIDPRGGPTLRFDVTFPRSGRYRTWLQFKRHGVVWTVPFTVEAQGRQLPRP